MAKLKKHSWDMMFYYPMGWLMLFAILKPMFADCGVKNMEIFAVLWMYVGCLLACWAVAEFNKPPKKKFKTKVVRTKNGGSVIRRAHR